VFDWKYWLLWFGSISITMFGATIVQNSPKWAQRMSSLVRLFIGAIVFGVGLTILSSLEKWKAGCL